MIIEFRFNSVLRQIINILFNKIRKWPFNIQEVFIIKKTLKKKLIKMNRNCKKKKNSHQTKI